MKLKSFLKRLCMLLDPEEPKYVPTKEDQIIKELEKIHALMSDINKQHEVLSNDIADLKEKQKQPEAFFASDTNQNVSPMGFWSR